MDNVLIDDRRIHVDFSQSVAKVQFQKQGNSIIFYKQSIFIIKRHTIIHLSHFITDLKMYRLYSLITSHHDLDSADPSSMHACRVWTHLNDFALQLFS